MNKVEEKLEVKSQGGSTTTVVSGDNAPWWVKYSMQAGFMFVLLLVLWGLWDLMKYKFPTLATPIVEIGETLDKMQIDTAKATDAKVQEAAAAMKQADAIERWVNQQAYRVTNQDPRFVGPPFATLEP